MINQKPDIMKYIDYLSWIFGFLAGLILLLGAIDFIFEAELFKVNHVVNYFHAANSFLLVSICCTLYLLLKQKKQE